jgi:hypothetical protein
MSVIKCTNFCKLIIEKMLRTAFSDTSTPAEYRYVANEADAACKIRIYREFPRRQFNPPFIVVAASAGDASLQYVGKENVRDVFIRYDEVVQSNTLAFVPLSVTSMKQVALGTTVTDEPVSSNYLDYAPLTSITSVSDPTHTTYYTEGVNFTVDKTKGLFMWITAQPAAYVCTYVVPSQYLPTGVTYTETTNYTVNLTTGVITWVTAQPTNYACTYLTFTNQKNVTYPSGKFVQSSLEVPVRITIYAMSTTDRERITDLVILYLRHVFRDYLAPYLSYISIKLGEETSTVMSNQTVYMNTVTIDCWTHYAHYIDQSLFELIKTVDVSTLVTY